MSSPLEPVDMIDEKGAVVKTVTKKEAHEEGLLHACVVGEVWDSEGRWMLVKQADDRQDAGQFVSPVGGHVGSGESWDDALKREAEEEVGITGEFTFERVGEVVFDRHVIGRHENHLFVLYVIHTDMTPTLNHEAVAYEYFTEDQLRIELKEQPEKFGDAFHVVVKEFFPHLLH